MGNPDEPLEPDIQKLLDRFLSGRAPHTVQAYSADLEDFASFIGGSLPGAAGDLLAGGPHRASRLVLAYAADLRRRGRAPATIERRLHTLRSFVRLAAERRLVGWSLELPAEDQIAASLPEGRGDVAYVLPRHPAEMDRLDLQHYALAAALGANHLAPVLEPRTVLDVGAGTGQWGYDLANDHPEAMVVGLDLKPPKPGAPAGYRAVLGNVLQGLPFGDASFDFVHQRLLFSGIPVVAWPDTVRDLVRTCRPGGWIELVEGATRFEPAGPATERLTELLLQLNRSTGLDSNSIVFSSLDSYLVDAGIREVTRRTVDMPLGEWAGPIGSLMASDIRALFTRVSTVFTARLDVPASECVELVRQAQVEWEEHHTMYRMARAWGRRPL
jgi:SAM-dependent methyltransferase